MQAVSALLGIAFSSTSAATVDDTNRDTTNELAPIEISALPFGGDADYTPASFSLLDDEYLLTNSRATLGDTLDGLPGVHSDAFGAGASRPVIRGQRSPRVSVLSDGASLFDASAISPDHAVTVTPMLARKIEVLRGPATLRYGGGAIGGVVNVLDEKIPTRMPDGMADGFASVRGDTAADERAGAFGVTLPAAGRFAIRVEGARRDADDYEVNGFTVPTIDGTFAESDTGTLGASWIGDKGYIGIAYSDRADKYGLPGHSHEFEDCTADGDSLVCGGAGHDHDHDHGGESPYVDLDSRRVDLRAEYRPSTAGIERVRVRSSHGDYRHDEVEHGVAGTTFRHEGYETRVEVEHAPLAGWRGIVGAQYSDSQFNTQGTEAFMPKTDTETVAVFAIERYRLSERWHMEVGARHERRDLNPVKDPINRPSSDMSADSASVGLVWEVRPDYNLALSLSRSQRLPNAQEMYARGVHLATNTYECGLVAAELTCGDPADDRSVEPETSHNIGLNLRRVRGDLTFDAGVFYNRIDDYIYARSLDRIEAFRLIKYTQDDAEFVGGELELTYRWNDRLTTTLFGDTVRGRLSDGNDDLPRMPADRLGVRVNTFRGPFDAEAEFYHVRDQRKIADFETTTPGHEMLNATIGYRVDAGQRYRLFVRGRNLLGEEVWNHTSFLADAVPAPGRNLITGVEIEF
ncbi:TonB-dependent receptor domain-containing protein [Salinisphaera sp. PC39]|uniref:TonB-dependent receptor domain-containing protein n=1 Tax=Salinisphaera sp. PC39 TaxID=1304156 RepID=UPI00333E23A6